MDISEQYGLLSAGEMIMGKLSCSLTTAEVIPSTAQVWSLVELGKLDELRHIFSHRSMSPFAVNIQGTSLLKLGSIFLDINVN